MVSVTIGGLLFTIYTDLARYYNNCDGLISRIACAAWRCTDRVATLDDWRKPPLCREHNHWPALLANRKFVRLAKVIDEIADTGAAKIDEAVAALPSDFPSKVAESISAGAKAGISSLARTPDTASEASDQ